MPKFTVTPAAARPAGLPTECFYCGRQVGDHHSEQCVLVQQKIKVEVNLTLYVEMARPADWDKAMIDFALNDGSWCASNAIDDVVAALKKIQASGNPCLCSDMTFDFMGKIGAPYLDEK